MFYMNGVEISLVSEYMIEYFNPEGFFLFFGLVSFCGYLFIISCMKETEGLTDKEKKELYLPDSIKLLR